MNIKSILDCATQFEKLALKKDPFRNAEHDMEEAFDYVSSSLGISLNDGNSFMDIPMNWLNIEKIENMPLKDVLSFDDYSAWSDVEPNEMKRMSKQDRALLLRRLRGRHAESWLEDGIPAIILLDICGFRAIGDGRGRTNFAVGMGFQMVPVIHISVKPEYQDKINLGAVS